MRGFVVFVTLIAVMAPIPACGPGAPDAIATTWVQARTTGDWARLEEHSAKDLYESIRRSSSPLGEEYDPFARPTLTVAASWIEGNRHKVNVDSRDGDVAIRYTLDMAVDAGRWKVIDCDALELAPR